MSATAASKHRQCWADRFETPEWPELLDQMPKAASSLLEYAHAKLGAIEALREEISWQGVWCWTLVFRQGGEGGRGLAYLVPDPARPRVCIPVPNALIPGLPIKKLSKFVRDGLLHAPAVDAVRWACWHVQSRSQVDELMALLGHRMAASAQVATPAPVPARAS